MNPVLEMKLEELKNAKDYECWYLVKQPTAFDNLCYLVSFLKEFQESGRPGNLQSFISRRIGEVNSRKPEVEISDNYRALRVAAFFGLITMNSAKYEEASITEAFEEIRARCGGEFEKKDLYQDIIQRQIEKMYISSKVDEEYNGVRRQYRLYPVMLLYKVLLELGRATGAYRLFMTEYRYLVATTKKYEDYLDTLFQIRLLRQDGTGGTSAQFEQYKAKFDNRLIQALKQLPTLYIDKNIIALQADALDEVAETVYRFENGRGAFPEDPDAYLEFLGSGRPLFDADEPQEADVPQDAAGPWDMDESHSADGFQDAGSPWEDDEETEPAAAPPDYDHGPRLEGGTNVLLYGVPGSGKSWTIEHEYRKKDTKVERLVFHPDYTHSDFVGQILPAVGADGQVSYEFTPGPFTRILREAYIHPMEEYLLIIEEINRGNAPAIFGDIFQLLDRKAEADEFPAGTSEYGITDADIARIVYEDGKHEVRIPSNLSIIGTMNTSDQDVFTLDTAFQRRWEMRLVENSFEYVDRKLADAPILDTGVTWKTFCTKMNDIIAENLAGMIYSEDKRLGAYFVNPGELRYDSAMEDRFPGEYKELCGKEQAGTLDSQEQERLAEIRAAMRQNRRFPEKVIKYLWDDAFRLNRDLVFDTDQYRSLEQVIRAFLDGEKAGRFRVFKESVRQGLTGWEE